MCFERINLEVCGIHDSYCVCLSGVFLGNGYLEVLLRREPVELSCVVLESILVERQFSDVKTSIIRNLLNLHVINKYRITLFRTGKHNILTFSTIEWHYYLAPVVGSFGIREFINVHIGGAGS